VTTKPTIAIIGTGPSWVEATKEPPSTKMWGIGATWQLAGRGEIQLDAYYELHEIEYMEEVFGQARADQILAWYEETDSKIYYPSHKGFKGWAPFPFTEIMAKFRPYFMSTAGWMIAHAIMQNPKEIKLFGVDMAAEAEDYTHQRANAEHLLGVAIGRGIKVTLPANCPLLNGPLYGHPASLATMKIRDRLQARLKVTQDELNALKVQEVVLSVRTGEIKSFLEALNFHGNTKTALDNLAEEGLMTAVMNGSVANKTMELQGIEMSTVPLGM
jgi:hypothetical protein